MVFGCLGRLKSHFSQKLPAEPIFQHFLAKVTIYYACNGYFRSKWSQMAEKCIFAKKFTFGPFGLPGGSQNDSNSLGFGARAPLGHISAKSALFHIFAHLGRGELTAIVLGPGRPPLRRATARGVGSIPLHGRSPSVPTHTHASVGVKPELIPFGAALRLLIPLTPIIPDQKMNYSEVELEPGDSSFYQKNPPGATFTNPFFKKSIQNQAPS